MKIIHSIRPTNLNNEQGTAGNVRGALNQPATGFVSAVCEGIFQISFKKPRFRENEIENKSPDTNGSRLHQIVDNLAGLGIVKLWGNDIEVKNRLDLAEILLRAGRSPATLSNFMSWKEFEEFCRDALEKNGFRVRSNVRFTWRKKRHEIDLVATKAPFLLFIDCKHWRPERSSGYRKAALKQGLRMEAALRGGSAIAIGTRNSRSHSKPLPLIVSLADVAVQEVEGIPVVSIFRLNNFLLELDKFWDELGVQPHRGISLENWTHL